ncbi:hypothetical protein KUV26_08950 [Leisingera daeponensis]|uniref:Uncharacterized protein n=1 Tax=Leisingera daeponensis TaxID=405746 RepID=A0ABS7NEB7_9RHOB|nr:hypothetical protein [Leisingera daeponensis]MBY6139557.1 hypothetical protein [Leisingera daeponensis]
MQKYLRLSYLGSASALLAAACCVLPVMLMLLGIGGSGLAVFGLIAAASYHVLFLSTALLLVAGWLSHTRGALARFRWWLAGSAALTAVAWLIALNESRINDYLIMQM